MHLVLIRTATTNAARPDTLFIGGDLLPTLVGTNENLDDIYPLYAGNNFFLILSIIILIIVERT